MMFNFINISLLILQESKPLSNGIQKRILKSFFPSFRKANKFS